MVDILVDGQLAIIHVVEEGFRTQAELANVRVLSEHLVSNTGPVELIRERTRSSGQDLSRTCQRPPKKALRCGKWLEVDILKLQISRCSHSISLTQP